MQLSCTCYAGVVSQYHGIEGVIAMNGGLPPADAFPFATLGGDLSPEPSPGTIAAAAAASATAAAAAAAVGGVVSSQPSSHPLHTDTSSHPLQTERVEITDPALVAQAQQYCFAPKVRKDGHSAKYETWAYACMVEGGQSVTAFKLVRAQGPNFAGSMLCCGSCGLCCSCMPGSPYWQWHSSTALRQRCAGMYGTG
jgi:hypothetical protein